jgi:pyrrolidone-carboxylate peptidase
LEKELKGRTIECESITPIPVNWGEIDKVIAKQTEKHKDARIIWIAFGAGPAFRIETRGDNTRLEGPDDAGQTPGVDVPSQNDTTPGAKDREVSQLTKEALQAIQEALKAQRFRVAISKEAGNYICESTAYGLHKAQRTGKIEAGIFIHTPPTLTAKQREEFAKALVDALFKDGEPIPGRLVPLPSKTK